MLSAIIQLKNQNNYIPLLAKFICLISSFALVPCGDITFALAFSDVLAGCLEGKLDAFEEDPMSEYFIIISFKSEK